MSARELNEAMGGLPAGRWGVADIERVLGAAGRSLGPDEQRLLVRLLEDAGDRLDDDGAARLKTALRRRSRASFRLDGHWRTDVPEPSGLSFVSPERGFVVVGDDTDALFALPLPDEGAGGEGRLRGARFAKGGGEAWLGLEGVAVDGDAILALNEGSAEVLELRGGARRSLGPLPSVGHRANKGWEGLALLPARLSPDGRAHLLAAHEGAPRGVAVLHRQTLAQDAWIPLPDGVRAADLSDLAVDPLSGHLFLLSDESENVHELLLDAEPGPDGAWGWTLTHLGETPIPHKGGGDRLQPEGLDFDARGDLWIIAERDALLMRFSRQA